MKKLMLAAGALALCAQASAALVDRGNFVTDTSTNLDWLKLTVLQRYSFEEVERGAYGYVTEGWRFANASDLLSLVTAYIGPAIGNYARTSNSSWTAADFAGANALVPLLGIVSGFNDPRAASNVELPLQPEYRSITTQGFMLYGSNNRRVGVTEITAIISTPAVMSNDVLVGPSGRWAIFERDVIDPDTAYAGLGSYLVRAASPVPEPSALALLAAGVCVLAMRAKGRRHRAAAN